MNTSGFRISPLQKLWLSGISSVVLLVLIVWAYNSETLYEASPYWSSTLVDILILIPAVFAAIASNLFVGQFDKSESPYRIWQAFSIGLWFWVAGEIGGIVYNTIYWDSVEPDFRLVDIFWLLGYFFLGLSLYYQLRVAYGAKSSRGRRFYLGFVALALLVTTGLTNLAAKAGLGEESAWIILFITVLYPVFDLTEGVIAIWLSFLFGRGQWSRPWWGLILFALADSVNTFYWLGGYSLISENMQTTLDFISLVVYPASYMVAGLALLSNYFILYYGEDSGLMKSVSPGSINNIEKK
jgi:hypothetical protein